MARSAATETRLTGRENGKSALMAEKSLWRYAGTAAASALEPFAAEAVEWAAYRFAQRWPELTRDVVVPALERALAEVGAVPAEQRDGAIRRAAVTGGAALLGSAATAAFLRR
jgi:hypothetical protein